MLFNFIRGITLYGSGVGVYGGICESTTDNVIWTVA